MPIQVVVPGPGRHRRRRPAAALMVVLALIAVVGGAVAVADAGATNGTLGDPSAHAATRSSGAAGGSPTALPSSSLTGSATRSAPTVAQPPVATVLNGGPLVRVVGEVTGSGGLAASCAKGSTGGVQVSTLRTPLHGTSTTVAVTWKLAPGTYTAWTCVQREGAWSRVSLTVGFTITPP